MANKELKLQPGVIFGDDVKSLFDFANSNAFAIPAVNVIGTNSVNAVLETAREINSPVIVQFSNGGAHFFGGQGLPKDCLLYTSDAADEEDSVDLGGRR